MFYLRFALSELRRRRGRTILTALGLAVGVGLVAVVTALSAGLDQAQDEVLEPLTGLGTDMTVTRPLRISEDGSRFVPEGGGANLTGEERRQLLQENRPAMIELDELGDPGDPFETDVFVSGTELSFAQGRARQIADLDGVTGAAGGLTLTAIHLEGEVPEAAPGPGGNRLSPGAVFRGNIDFEPATVGGVDVRRPDLGLVTPGQVTAGRYFAGRPAAAKSQVVLAVAYAARKNLDVGESVSIGGESFTVVGLSEPPLGGQAIDIFAELSRLQEAAGREGRINSIQVRADDAGQVDAIAASIPRAFPGSQVTTASDLASGISGSLVDADNLATSLGTALAVVAMAAAVLVASLLTLASVTKRTRELGTLKALGWPGRLVVRQVAGESLAQGLLGGAIGVVLGIAGAAIITAVGPTLTASAEPELSGLAFGQGEVEASTTSVALTAPIDLPLILLAVGLAVLGGLIAGAVGGLRAARLRPADALRHVE